jgi:aspartyl-tRNA(Asn)/glutamyl-tRNA(Gln) amidotransferase subunit B
MFCGCAVGQLGDAPNSNVCEICLGLPGTLPVINKAAVEATLKTALALNCEIPRHTKWDRKNYMYPDLPKGYQISQYDLPMSQHGFLELKGQKVRIRRVHLEEDTGKLVHAGDKLQKAWESYVDLNRAGVPLMEIVSEPDLHRRFRGRYGEGTDARGAEHLDPPPRCRPWRQDRAEEHQLIPSAVSRYRS